MRIKYRIWQFVQLIAAPAFSPSARAEVDAILSRAESNLFDRFGESDKWHGYRVMSDLRQAGIDNHPLLVAALLHDVGKTKYRVTVFARVLIVLGRLLPEQLTEQWGDTEPSGWKLPFVVKKQHPIWSAEMGEAAGSSQQAIRFMLRHQEKLPDEADSVEDQLLRQLQWADDNN